MSNPSQHSEPSPIEQDWLLEDLVALANRVHGVGFGVTLMLPGAVVTGRLVGVKEYFAAYGELWEQSMKSEAGRSLRTHYTEIGEKSAAALAESEEPPQPKYVHLRDAKIVTGSALIPTQDGLLWRGRISEVAGFSMGILGVST